MEILTFGETWAKEAGNLLNEGLRRKESIVFVSELLDKLLFLFSLYFKMKMWRKKNEIAGVLLQIINRHVLQLYLLSMIDISCVCENANGHARTGNIQKSIYGKI